MPLLTHAPRALQHVSKTPMSSTNYSGEEQAGFADLSIRSSSTNIALFTLVICEASK